MGIKKSVFQLESGSESGFLHYQAMFSLKRKRRLKELISVMDSLGLFPGRHLSPQCTKNLEDWSYAGKEETRVEGPWIYQEPLYIPRQVRECPNLRSWQKRVLEDVGVWNTRIINVIICPGGNIGKSVLVGHMRSHRLGCMIPLVKNYKDLLRIVMCKPTSNMYLVDVPRAAKSENMGEFWAALESIKDGYAYDDRYAFKDKHFDCPNIWVFTNKRPEAHFLSKDRWLLWEVVDQSLVAYMEPISADAPTASQMGQVHAAINFSK